MSLVVWLPLNGNLDNQGLATNTFSNEGSSYITVDNSGKIGKCYNFNSTANNLGIYSDDGGFMDKYINNRSWTICAWVQTSSSDTIVISLSYGLRMFVGAPTFIALYNSSRTVNCISSVSANDGKWHHLAATYNVSTNTIKFYVDGVNTGTQAYTSGYTYASSWVNGLYIGKDPNNSTVNDHYLFKGKMNDVRVYDHALSPREVAELAKGMVLHYPLNDSFIESTTNLCTTSAGGWNNSGTCTRNTDDTSILAKPTPGAVYSLTATSDGSMAISLGNTSASLPSKTLVASVYCWLDGTQDSQSVYLRSQKTDGSVGNLTYNGEANPTLWPKKRWIRLISSPITTASDATTFYICTYVNKNTEVRAFNGWQLEENIHVTEWVAPGTTRAASTIVYDTSGFGYNGEINTAMIVSDNTPRYSKSTVFDGVGNCIKVPFNDMLGTTLCDYTLSFWVRKDVLGSKGYQTMFGGPSGYELEARRGDNHEFQLYSWGGSYTAYEFGQWYHLAFVHSTTVVKLYVNGEAKISGGTPKANPSGNYYIGAWNSVTQQNFQGQMSDFRIYATALTADQVKQLYEAPISLANNGTLFANEFNET